MYMYRDETSGTQQSCNRMTDPGCAANDMLRMDMRQQVQSREDGNVNMVSVMPGGNLVVSDLGTVNGDSFQQKMSRFLGRYVICEMLVSNQPLIVREGLLTDVGQSFFVLYDDLARTETACDLYALKFMTVFEQGRQRADVNNATREYSLSRCHDCSRRSIPVNFVARD